AGACRSGGLHYDPLDVQPDARLYYTSPMPGRILLSTCVFAAGVLTSSAQPPQFKPAPEVPAMPKALMKLPRTEITRPKFPAVDCHLHGGSLKTADDYRKMIATMDKTGVALICNMDGGFGPAFDQNIKVGDAYKDRVLQFARVNWQGINEPGWSEKAA